MIESFLSEEDTRMYGGKKILVAQIHWEDLVNVVHHRDDHCEIGG